MALALPLVGCGVKLNVPQTPPLRQPGVRWLRVAKIGTPNTVIRHHFGAFTLRSGAPFTPPFYCRNRYRIYNEPGSNRTWHVWDPPVNRKLIKAVAIARENGAELVRITTPAAKTELYGVLWISGMPAEATGPKSRSYYITLPTHYVREASGGRVAVIFETLGKAHRVNPFERYKHSRNRYLRRLYLKAKSTGQFKPRHYNWILWLSDVPFAMPRTKVGLGLRLSRAVPGAIDWAYPGSSASQAGIQPGDRILSVDGQSVQGWTLEQISGAISKAGSQVKLRIARRGQQGSEELTLAKQAFKY